MACLLAFLQQSTCHSIVAGTDNTPRAVTDPKCGKHGCLAPVGVVVTPTGASVCCDDQTYNYTFDNIVGHIDRGVCSYLIFSTLLSFGSHP